MKPYAHRRGAPTPTVFVVHSEWQEAGDGGHSIVEGVYPTHDEAKAAAFTTTKAYEALGRVAWIPSTYKNEGDERSDWDFDVHVSQHVVGGGS